MFVPVPRGSRAKVATLSVCAPAYLDLGRLAAPPLVHDEDRVAGAERRARRVRLEREELAPIRRVLPERVHARVHALRAALAALDARLERAALVNRHAALE